MPGDECWLAVLAPRCGGGRGSESACHPAGPGTNIWRGLSLLETLEGMCRLLTMSRRCAGLIECLSARPSRAGVSFAATHFQHHCLLQHDDRAYTRNMRAYNIIKNCLCQLFKRYRRPFIPGRAYSHSSTSLHRPPPPSPQHASPASQQHTHAQLTHSTHNKDKHLASSSPSTCNKGKRHDEKECVLAQSPKAAKLVCHQN